MLRAGHLVVVWENLYIKVGPWHSETGALWADALCINQKNDVKQSTQVAAGGIDLQEGYQGSCFYWDRNKMTVELRCE